MTKLVVLMVLQRLQVGRAGFNKTGGWRGGGSANWPTRTAIMYSPYEPVGKRYTKFAVRAHD